VPQLDYSKQLEELILKNDDIVFTKTVSDAGIPRTYLSDSTYAKLTEP